MAEQPKKQYINGIWIRSHKFQDGNEVLNISVSGNSIDELSATLKGLAKETGWARLVISPRKTPDEKSTHSIFVDTFKPKAKDAPKATKPDDDEPPC